MDDEPLILQGMVLTVRNAIPDAEIFSFLSSRKVLSWFEENSADLAFLDIEMPELSGMTLAKSLHARHPELNIVFTTSYPDYAVESYHLRASGYLLKPVSEDDILREVENLRYLPDNKRSKKLRLKAFGNFEAFSGEESLHFRYSKTMELLAYLTDRQGAFCSNGELEAVLWEDTPPSNKTGSYLRQLRKDLVDTIEMTGTGDVVELQRGKMRLRPEGVDCDYYEWLRGTPEARSRYQGEYMSQYSWAELTNGWLLRMTEHARGAT